MSSFVDDGIFPYVSLLLVDIRVPTYQRWRFVSNGTFDPVEKKGNFVNVLSSKMQKEAWSWGGEMTQLQCWDLYIYTVWIFGHHFRPDISELQFVKKKRRICQWSSLFSRPEIASLRQWQWKYKNLLTRHKHYWYYSIKTF